jgi:transcriptional regulator NrdR family protein
VGFKNCTNCNGRLGVVDSRESEPDVIARRYKCQKCGSAFYTHETFTDPPVKKLPPQNLPRKKDDGEVETRTVDGRSYDIIETPRGRINRLRG